MYVDFTQLLDPNYVYTDDEDAFYGMLSNLIQQGKTYINGNSTTNGGDTLAINNLMQQFLGVPPVFRTELSDVTLDLPGLGSIVLTGIRVGGLDTFNMVNILNPTFDDPQTIQNEFGLDELTIELELLEAGETTPTTIGLAFSDVVLSVPLYLAIKKDAMLDFPVGALLQTEYLMPCLTSVVDAFEISKFDVQIGTIERPTSSSSTDSRLFQLIQTVFVTLPATVPTFFDAAIRPLINNMIPIGQDENESTITCPSENTDEINTYLEFPKFFAGGLPAIAKSFLEAQYLTTDPSTGLPMINSLLVQPMTYNQSGIPGTLLFQDALMDVGTRISIGGLEADIKLRVTDMKVENVDTIKEPLVLLDPINDQPHTLNNTATVGLELDDRPLSLSMRLFISIITAGT